MINWQGDPDWMKETKCEFFYYFFFPLFLDNSITLNLKEI